MVQAEIPTCTTKSGLDHGDIINCLKLFVTELKEFLNK